MWFLLNQQLRDLLASKSKIQTMSKGVDLNCSRMCADKHGRHMPTSVFFWLSLSTSKLRYHQTIDQKTSIRMHKSSNSSGKCYKPISYSWIYNAASLGIDCCLWGMSFVFHCVVSAICVIFYHFGLDNMNTIRRFLVFITAIYIVDTGYHWFMPSSWTWLSFFLSCGTFWTTFGQSPQRDKVLRWGAHFGPHLVKVCSMTKSSKEGHILDHIWSKSAAWQSPPMRGTFLDHIWLKSAVWQSPPMRGTFWATFGQSPLRDKVFQWGAHFGPHLVKSPLCDKKSSNKGHFWTTFGRSPLCDKVLHRGAYFRPVRSTSAV